MEKSFDMDQNNQQTTADNDPEWVEGVEEEMTIHKVPRNRHRKYNN